MYLLNPNKPTNTLSYPQISVLIVVAFQAFVGVMGRAVIIKRRHA